MVNLLSATPLHLPLLGIVSTFGISLLLFGACKQKPETEPRICVEGNSGALGVDVQTDQNDGEADSAEGLCSSGTINNGCEAKPKGLGSGIGNMPEYSVCIPSKATNTKKTCKKFQRKLEDKAGRAALKVCAGKVKCINKSCKEECRNAVSLSDSQGMLLAKNSSDCKKGEDKCQLANTAWDCTCDCPIQP